MKDKLIEQLAALAHDQWSGWMYYMFSKCVQEERFDNGEFFKTGNMIIPEWAVERWVRQMQTKYKDLSEEEKNSDREEAERVIGILKYNKII